MTRIDGSTGANGGLTPWHVEVQCAMAESDSGCTRASCSLESGAKLSKHLQGPSSPAGNGEDLGEMAKDRGQL